MRKGEVELKLWNGYFLEIPASNDSWNVAHQDLPLSQIFPPSQVETA